MLPFISAPGFSAPNHDNSLSTLSTGALLLLLPLFLGLSLSPQATPTHSHGVRAPPHAYKATPSDAYFVSPEDREQIKIRCEAYPPHKVMGYKSSVFPKLAAEVKESDADRKEWAWCATKYAHLALNGESPNGDLPSSKLNEQPPSRIHRIYQNELHANRRFTGVGAFHDHLAGFQVFAKNIDSAGPFIGDGVYGPKGRKGSIHEDPKVKNKFARIIKLHLEAFAHIPTFVIQPLDVVVDHDDYLAIILHDALEPYTFPGMTTNLVRYVEAERTNAAWEIPLAKGFGDAYLSLKKLNQEVGIIHRNLNPETLIHVANGASVLKIWNFDLAVKKAEVPEVCRKGEYKVGTPGFIPWAYYQPKSSKTEEHVLNADLYGFFATLYDALLPHKAYSRPSMDAGSYHEMMKDKRMRDSLDSFKPRSLSPSEEREAGLAEEASELFNTALKGHKEQDTAITYEDIDPLMKTLITKFVERPAPKADPSSNTTALSQS
ncbi:hypothetical protein BJ684DRAFT_19730 [Piptocephalis cylindrospora]|uniref:Protein kinase domain-containing protein n=1 Tax=Piptocephalis cylindrospora TaxID=1907219 RepID=A0A4P9Y4B3_9FUNG|nr:hypothetical protein BJ684DRAFT_19730 [Piptocephalis cylindrospora]|eukprot:RKP13806.1 hypothetical protein BJ684DRAFT_19730 [Piptocephalis cylindrospora]